MVGCTYKPVTSFQPSLSRRRIPQVFDKNEKYWPVGWGQGGEFIGIFIYLLFSAEGDWAAHDKLHLNIKCKGSYNASNTFTVSSALCHLSNPWAPILGGWMSGSEPHSALYDYIGLHLHNVSFENIHINKCTQYILVAMSLTFFFFFSPKFWYMRMQETEVCVCAYQDI